MESLELLKRKIQQEKFAIVYFSTSTCSVCKVLKPKIKKLLDSNFPKVQFFYVDIEKLEQAKGEYLVFAVPTVIIFVEGKEIHRFSRNLSIKQLNDFILRYYSIIFV